jgi:N-acetyl-gamma-glutamyl-phosphate reductase
MGRSAVVLGASGYSGGELLRYLSDHPGIETVAMGGDRRAGEELRAVHPHLLQSDDVLVSIEEAVAIDADLCFSCLPSGALSSRGASVGARILIDLSDDFRADPGWVYGLTEWARDEVRESRRISNPGCYPTATLLGLLPFATSGLIRGPVIVDALSGVSGAGRSAQDHLLFSHLDSCATAYGTTQHRHIPEMERGLSGFGGTEVSLSFTPHLVPMARGLLVTARAPLSGRLSDDQALEVLHDAYDAEPFVHVVSGWPLTKAVSGSNSAHVHARVDARNDLLICSVAIDNLGKGAAGQAIQNANLALGLEEGAGLRSPGVWP